MESLVKIKELLDAQRPFFVRYRPNLDVDAVCAAMAARVGQPVAVFRLQGGNLLAEDGQRLRTALLSKQVVLLVSRHANETAVGLADEWANYLRGDSFASYGPHFTVREEDRQRSQGSLVPLLPGDYAGPLPKELRYHVDVGSLEELGGPAEARCVVVEAGRSWSGVSMKSLWFLHHRDGEGVVHHASIDDIMSGDRPLSWLDLRQLLRAQADLDMLNVLESLAKSRRISEEQLDLADEAVSFLRREYEPRPRLTFGEIAPSVYHVLWDSWDRDGAYVYRGQRNSTWRQDSSLFRAEENGSPPSLRTLVARLGRAQAFLDRLAPLETEMFGRALTEDERVAVAQHYGLPTPLLDYTRSIEVAAFFATGQGDKSKVKEGEIGVIYRMRADAREAEPERTTLPDGLEVASSLGVRFGHLTAIEPHLPDPHDRIGRQKGVFIDGFDSRDLQRLTMSVWYFRQVPGEVFEDPRRELTASRLLEPDSRLQALAESVESTTSRVAFSERLTGARIPGDDLFGSTGHELVVTLPHAQRFLDELAKDAERIEPGLWTALRAVLVRHIAAARIRALTADVARAEGERTSERDEVDATFAELEKLAGLQRGALHSEFVQHRPGRADARRAFDRPSGHTKGDAVRSAAAFVVALEHLRTVRGDLAQRYL